jgi:acetylornithine deacetylase/succinyl-diaminopimelate desuccinylase family protein
MSRIDAAEYSFRMNPSAHLLRDLVRIPSVNPMGRDVEGPTFLEGRVADYVARFVGELGVRVERQTVLPGRDNVVAHFESPDAKQTLVFEAHEDTVPVDGMTIDPFGGEIRNGRLYGRGACDVKGGMASMLSAFARIVRERPRGAPNVVIACTIDEEHTFLGVQRLVGGLTADAAVVAEPTMLKIVHAHKGVVRWHIMTSGRSCHSSRPEQGINAIYRMGRLLGAIESYAKQLAQSASDPMLGSPTLSVGRIDGGLSVNTVPDFCRIEIDRRLIPGEDSSQAVQHCESYLRGQSNLDAAFSFSKPWLHCPALPSQRDSDIARRLGESVAAVIGKCEMEAVPYGTDASSLAEVGIPSVVFGPGDIAQAHTADEWIELEQVDRAAEVLFRLARDWSR